MSTSQLFIVFLFLVVRMASGCTTSVKHKTKCCRGLGCFSNEKPWRSITRPIPEVQCQDVVKVHFLLFTRKNPKEPFNITSWPRFTLEGSHFNVKWQTVFFTHGWTATTNDSKVYELKDATLSCVSVDILTFSTHKNISNVILVDWSASSQVNYMQAVSNIRVVAAQIVSLIHFMMDKYGLRTQNLKLIGHSLGAHTSAYVGQAIPNISWITGLDPAGPLFQGFSRDIQLSSDDANYVDVVHTDILVQFPFIGFGESSAGGHKDFYFNKGYHQPGCLSETSHKALEDFRDSFSATEEMKHYMVCSHDRAIFYYSDAFRYTNCTYWAQKDASMGSNCKFDTCAPFGPCSNRFPATGSFLAITRGTAPYCERNVKVCKQIAAVHNRCMKTVIPADYQQGVLSEKPPDVSFYAV